MVRVGQTVEVTISGRKERVVVIEFTTCPFGATLPEGWLDVTNDQDQHNGIRVGIKYELQRSA